MRLCGMCGAMKRTAEFRPPPHQNQCKDCYNEYMRLWRAARGERNDVPTCSVSGCSRVVIAQELCQMHYNRLIRYGHVGDAEPWIGSGDAVGYKAVHRRLMTQRGRASDYACTCGARAQHWAFVERLSDEPIKVDNGLRYSTDLSAYVPMCATCHSRHDGGQMGESNGNAVLTAEDVVTIRRRHAAEAVTYGQLGEEHGVSAATIGCIIRRETWKHI